MLNKSDSKYFFQDFLSSIVFNLKFVWNQDASAGDKYWILLLIKLYHTEKQNSKSLEALFDGQWQKNSQMLPSFLGQATCQPSTHWLGFPGSFSF